MTFTKEWLQQTIAAMESLRDEAPFGISDDHDMTIEALKMALAGMEEDLGRNPVLAYADSYRDMAKQGVESIPVWSVITDLERNIAPHIIAPQLLTTSERAELENYRNAQQVVPDEVMPGGLVYSSVVPKFESNDSDKVVGYHCFISGDTRTVDSQEQAYSDAKSVVSACRAAMLQGKAAGNSPVIPDGWVVVPVEPTEDMIIQGFESEPDESFSEEKDWLTYEAMSGCQQAAHRAKLCWAAMIAAAPQQEAE